MLESILLHFLPQNNSIRILQIYPRIRIRAFHPHPYPRFTETLAATSYLHSSTPPSPAPWAESRRNLRATLDSSPGMALWIFDPERVEFVCRYLSCYRHVIFLRAYYQPLLLYLVNLVALRILPRPSKLRVPDSTLFFSNTAIATSWLN